VDELREGGVALAVARMGTRPRGEDPRSIPCRSLTCALGRRAEADGEAMLRRIGVIISVGLADSLNPSTVGPALYLATAGRRVWRVMQFTIGVFAVNFVAGLVLTIGPGRSLIGLIPHPHRGVRHVLELIAGIVLLVVAVALWRGRRSLARRELPMRSGNAGGSALIAGASIAAIELPTAVPYFAVIAAIVASNATLPQEIGLLAIYNVAFVLPLLAIVVALLLAGEQADPWLQRGGAWMQRRWPVVLASLLLLVGSALAVLGGTGLVHG
jgi:cytochrome c biogenesis protein CcdA